MADTTRRRWLRLSAGLAGAGLLAGRLAQAAETRRQNLQPFTRVAVALPAEITIEPGERAAAEITAEAAALEHIVIEQSGDELRVTSRGSFQTREPITVRVTAPGPIEALDVTGAATVSFEGPAATRLAVSAADSAEVALEGLNLEALELDIGGSASVQAAGTTAQQQLRVSDAASFEGRQLMSTRSQVRLSGSAEAVIAVSDHLDARADGASVLVYSGDPKVQSDVRGAASIERE